jgi:hypothetical protein
MGMATLINPSCLPFYQLPFHTKLPAYHRHLRLQSGRYVHVRLQRLPGLQQPQLKLRPVRVPKLLHPAPQKYSLRLEIYIRYFNFIKRMYLDIF